MLFGGNFDPAYVMSVFALPFELQPTTNKRNAALIQKYMEDDIGVPPSRGFLRFITTPEEHTAWKGKTLAGEIDDLEKEAPVGEETGAVRSDGRRTKSKRLSVRVSLPASFRMERKEERADSRCKASIHDFEVSAGERSGTGADTTS